MESEFWVYCWKHGTPKAKAYAWLRTDISKNNRQLNEESFLRSRPGKAMHAKFWQRNFSDSDEEYPDDEVEILQRCVRHTMEEICGASDSMVLNRALDSYTAQLGEEQIKRRKPRHEAYLRKRSNHDIELARQRYGNEGSQQKAADRGDSVLKSK